MIRTERDPDPSVATRAKSFLRRHASADLRGHLRQRIVSTPGISEVYYRLDPGARTIRLHRGTEIVIDGFPRSANTFAVESFLMANTGHSVAHHLHDRRRIRKAVKWGIPVILIIREPDGCVNSFVNAITTTPADFFFTEYAKFYEGLTDILSGVIVAEFFEITTAWPAIIDRFNLKFGTDYDAVSAESSEQVFQRVDEFGKSHAFGDAQFTDAKFEKVVSRPSSTRSDLHVSELATPRVRQRALEAYSRIVAGTGAGDALCDQE